MTFAAVGVVSGLLSLASSVLLDLSRLDHGQLVADPASIVRLGRDHAGMFRWSDLLAGGSFLFLLPLALYMRNKFRDRHPMTIDVATVAAVISVGAGAAGAAVWASATPLISAYATASPNDRPNLAVIFSTVLHVGAALWHFVEGPATAVWFASVAIAVRDRWSGFAVYSAVVAAAIALGSLGTMLLPDASSSAPSTLYLLPIAVWPAWLAVRIWRDAPPTAA